MSEYRGENSLTGEKISGTCETTEDFVKMCGWPAEQCFVRIKTEKGWGKPSDRDKLNLAKKAWDGVKREPLSPPENPEPAGDLSRAVTEDDPLAPEADEPTALANHQGDVDPKEVVCTGCGTVQGFAGWDVTCESCGANEWEVYPGQDDGPEADKTPATPEEIVQALREAHISGGHDFGGNTDCPICTGKEVRAVAVEASDEADDLLIALREAHENGWHDDAPVEDCLACQGDKAPPPETDDKVGLCSQCKLTMVTCGQTPRVEKVKPHRVLECGGYKPAREPVKATEDLSKLERDMAPDTVDHQSGDLCELCELELGECPGQPVYAHMRGGDEGDNRVIECGEFVPAKTADETPSTAVATNTVQEGSEHEKKAFERQLEIKQLALGAESIFLQMGQLLYDAREAADWTTFRYDNFKQYIENLELPMSNSYSWATRLLNIWEFFVVKFKPNHKALVKLGFETTEALYVKIGVAKLTRLLPVARDSKLTLALLEKALILSDRDLRALLGEGDGEGGGDESATETIVCPHCGATVYNAKATGELRA